MVDRLWRAGLVVAYRVLRVYWWLFEPRTEGVCVLVWHAGRLLVVRHSYKPGIGVPAGAPHRGETAMETALRELREEVGIVMTAGALRPLGDFHPRHEHKRDHLVAFETEVHEEPTVQIDRREIVAAWWATPDELAAEEIWPPLHELLATSRERPGAAR